MDVGANLDKAMLLMAQGKHVRLDQPDEVATLCKRIYDLEAKAKERGAHMPTLDLCYVSVPGTNIFCHDTKGIPRIKMPQMGGVPTPGSPAAQRYGSDGFVDLSRDFLAALAAKGIKVTQKTRKADRLRATQNELNGAKVSKAAREFAGGKQAHPIFVTRDGYILDGHHTWAGQIVNDSRDNHFGDVDVPVNEIDLDIGAALDFANAWTVHQGIPPRGVEQQMAQRAAAYLGLADEQWAYISDLIEDLGQRFKSPKVCFQAAEALFRKFGWDVESGYYKAPGWNEGHYWNRLPNGTIVDITHDQFDEPDEANDPVLIVPPGDPRQRWYMRERTAALDTAWRPTKGMFSPGKPTLDPRVFDVASETMRPEVRDAVMRPLRVYWDSKYPGWEQWARVYLAGSGASYWWDSDHDFDTLIGIDVTALRQARPANIEVSEADIVAHLDRELKTELDPTTTAISFGTGEPFEVTYFVNPDSFDINDIKPYAAYSMWPDEGWVVHPPVLPADWGPEKFSPEVWQHFDQIAREAEGVLDIGDPAARHQACVALFDRLHSWRQSAYSNHGRGWLDIGNVYWQALSQTPGRLLQRLYAVKHDPAFAVTASAAGTYYHAAPRRVRESIRQHGLDPARGSSPWKSYEWIKYPTGTYLFADPMDAARYVHGFRASAIGFEKDWDIWQVDASGLDLTADPLVERDPGPFKGAVRFSPEPIGAERVTLLTKPPVTAGPVRDRIIPAMRRMVPPGELRKPRPVELDRGAEEDLRKLPGDIRNALVRAVHQLEDGKADLEAKARQLAGAYSLRLSNAWRALVYLGEDLFWHLFAITDHDYSEVSRRFASQYTVEVEWAPYGNPDASGGIDLGQTQTRQVVVEADSDHEATLQAAQIASGVAPGWNEKPGKYDYPVNPIVPTGPKGMVTRTRIIRMEAGAKGDLPPLRFAPMPRGAGPVQRISRGARSIGAIVTEAPEGVRLERWGRGEDGYYAGHIYWNSDTGEVEDLYVVPDLQRRGIASALWEEARRQDPRVKHSDTQTEQGRSWAQHVGAAGYRIDPETSDTKSQQDGRKVRVLYAVDDHGEDCGYISWYLDNLSVEIIAVREDMRRKGIATALWEAALKIVPDLKHSQNVSPDGKRWIKSLGGKYDSTEKRVTLGGTEFILVHDPLGGLGASRRVVPYVEVPGMGRFDQGYLSWFEGGEIAGVQVKPSYRRIGLATAMLDFAREIEPSVHHSHALTEDGQAWSATTAGLTDADVVSVAEHVMEQNGHTGKQWHVPHMHVDDPRRVPAQKPVNDWVNGVLREHGHDGGIRVKPKHWDLRNGGGQAVTDGMNWIGIAGEDTHDLTLLHEIAHILARTPEGSAGHNEHFTRIAGDLYEKHLGPEAASIFRDITGAHQRISMEQYENRFYPAKGGGKYHRINRVTDTARCRGIELDTTAMPITVDKNQEKVHPIVCKRCLNWKGASKTAARIGFAPVPDPMGFLPPPIVGGEFHNRPFDNWALLWDGEQVGTAQVYPPTKDDPTTVIGWININEEHRRKNIGSTFLQMCRQRYGAPLRADSFTDLGDKALKHHMGAHMRDNGTGHWDRSDPEPRWVQDHDELLQDALWSLKGHTSTMHIHLRDVRTNAPQPSSGSGKQMRAQAEALWRHLNDHGRTNDIPLYRGSHEEPGEIEAWSEDPKVAQQWARKGGGKVWVLKPGEGHGVRVADHITSGLDQTEREWVVHNPNAKGWRLTADYRGPTQEAPEDIAHDNAAIYLTGNPPQGSDLVREFAVTPAATDFFAGEADDLSRAYRDMPILDPSVVPLWQELAAINAAQAAALRSAFTVIVHDDLDPYETAEQMHADIDNGIYQVTSLHSHHPVWTPQQNVDFRIVHDLMGHGVANSDFSLKGEVQAYQAQCKVVPVHLWPVLFTEIIAQASYANTHHLFGEQKVGLVPLTQAQIDAHVGKIMDAADPEYDALHYSASAQGVPWSRTAAPNMVPIFNGSGEKHYEYNKPYIGVAASSPMGGGLTQWRETQVPVPWQGDIEQCIREAEQKAERFLKGDDFWSNLFVQRPDSKVYLTAGSGEGTKVIGVAHRLGDNWMPPRENVDYHEAWPEFLHLLASNKKLAWEQFCMKVADAQPPGFNLHPLAPRGNDIKKTVIYRGITLKMGEDPTTSTAEDRGKKLGSSWTLDFNVAKRIAERSGAGFTGGNYGPSGTHLRKAAPRPGYSIPQRPVVIRAEVDLGAEGVGLLSDGRMYYAEEQEVDVHPGTTVHMTGYMEANAVPVDQRAYERALEKAKADVEKQGFSLEDYEVRYVWPRSFTNVSIRREASHWVHCDQGHEHWGPSGAAGVLLRHTDAKGVRRYLLERRADWVDHGGTWGIPGGAINPGESPEQAAQREAAEELGRDVHFRHVRTHTDDHGGWAYHTVIGDTDDPIEGGRTHESHGTRWVTEDEMKQLPLHPGFAATWQHVREGFLTAAN